jgi:hypothetical protein
MKHVLLLFVIVVGLASSAADAPPPGEIEIKQALERGKSVRAHQGLLPEALVKTAVILKAGDARCGHAYVKIEPANGEGGAVYKLTEKFKAAMPKGNDMEVMEYTGTLLLDSDLALISATQASERVTAAGNSLQKETSAATVVVKNDEMSWVRKDKRDNDPELVEQNAGEEPKKLHGVRPIPRNALIALAAFAAKQPGFKAGVSSPFCVPSIDMGWTMDQFMFEPVWMETDVPPKEKAHEKAPPGASLLLRVRMLHGEIDEKGIKVEPPIKPADPLPEGIKTDWEDIMVWTFDENFRVVAAPTSEGTDIQPELADPDKIVLDEKLDFDKIRAEMDAIEAKKRRDLERSLRTPPVPPAAPVAPPADPNTPVAPPKAPADPNTPVAPPKAPAAVPPPAPPK